MMKQCGKRWVGRYHFELIYYQIQKLIISMKKQQADSSRSGFSRKKQRVSPTRFPKKQFEFIYREKDHLATSQAFQSIIFMKSKKCEPKSTHSTHKNTTKDKKPNVEELKQVITEIQKQLNQQDRRKNKRFDDHTKPEGSKNVAHSIANPKKTVHHAYKNKSSHKMNKAQKIDITKSDHVKNYKNLLSPNKQKTQKVVESNSHSTKFAKTTQETFRKNDKAKETRKENRDNLSEPEEYILVGNQFVSVNLKETEKMQQKLLSSRNDQNHIKTSQPLKKCQYGVQSPIYEDQRAEQAYQQYFEDDQSQSEADTLNNSQAQHEIFIENNLLVVQKYIVSKVKVIQRWWRAILQNRINRNPLVQSDNDLEDMQLAQNSKIQEKQQTEMNGSNFEFCNKMIPTDHCRNNSPIKLVDQFFGLTTSNEAEVVSSRQIAAKTQLQAHKSILQKLLASKKITPEIYMQRKEMIQAKYFSELQQIQQLRNIIKKNVERAAEIHKKTQQDLQTLEKSDLVVNNNLLNQIFGAQFAECFQDQHQDEHKFNEVQLLQNRLIANRQKSQGCHYQSQETVKTSLYKKQSKETQNYNQGFEEYDEGNQNNVDFSDFYSQNLASGSALNSNFKDLFQEFKLREEAKAEIDRRAAIQLGVLFQEVPEQIKNQIVSIDTSLNSIHRFLLAFFKYYIYYNKFEFLRLINMPYGLNIEKRIKALQGYSVDESFEEDQDGVIYGLDTIIPEEMFEQFYQKVYSLGEENQKSAKIMNFQLEKLHNKAIFDCFNESLNYFRPYFTTNGPPYPWCYSQKGLTFYFIAQDNIPQVFQKTEIKVLKWTSSLCGLILNKFSNPVPPITEEHSAEDIVEHYKQANHPLLNETRQERLTKNEQIQMIERQNEWSCFMEQQTYNSFQIADYIFDKIVEEMRLVLVGRFLEEGENYGDNQMSEKQMKTGLQSFQNVSSSSSLSQFQMF